MSLAVTRGCDYPVTVPGSIQLSLLSHRLGYSHATVTRMPLIVNVVDGGGVGSV